MLIDCFSVPGLRSYLLRRKSRPSVSRGAEWVEESAHDDQTPSGRRLRAISVSRHIAGMKDDASMARGMGVEFEVLDAQECARRHPLISTENLVGGLWDPHDGDIDPAQLCQALAFHARKAGAEVYRNTPVTDLVQHNDGSWTVVTEKGSIDAEIIVNAGGYRCNEVGAMMGVTHPVASMEHQYF